MPTNTSISTASIHNNALITELIQQSDLLLMVIALWIFVQAIRPIYRGVLSLFSKDSNDIQKNNQEVRSALTTWRDAIQTSSQKATDTIVGMMDMLWKFDSNSNKNNLQTSEDTGTDTTLAHKKTGIAKLIKIILIIIVETVKTIADILLITNLLHYFRFWSTPVLMQSWLMAFIYLALSLVLLGFATTPWAIWWQFVFLLCLYLLLLRLTIYFRKIPKDGSMVTFIAGTGTLELGLALAGSGALALALALAGAVAVTLAGAVAVAVALSGTVALPGTVALAAEDLAKIRARATTVIVAVAVTGALAMAMAVTLDSNMTLYSSNVFEMLTNLPSPREEQSGIFFVFFFIMPLLNGFLDSLSVSVSRYEFSKLQSNADATHASNHGSTNPYSLRRFLRVSFTDCIWAILFKAGVLAMLWGASVLFGHTGGTFTHSQVTAYGSNLWQGIITMWSTGGTGFDFMLTGTTNTMVTLMIGTTLIPTLLHFGFVCWCAISTALSQGLRIVGILCTGNNRFVAGMLSVLITVLIFALFAVIKKMAGI